MLPTCRIHAFCLKRKTTLDAIWQVRLCEGEKVISAKLMKRATVLAVPVRRLFRFISSHVCAIHS